MGNRGSGFGIRLLSPARVSQGLLRGPVGAGPPSRLQQEQLLAQLFQVKKSLGPFRKLQPATLGLEVVDDGLRAASDPKQRTVAGSQPHAGVPGRPPLGAGPDHCSRDCLPAEPGALPAWPCRSARASSFRGTAAHTGTRTTTTWVLLEQPWLPWDPRGSRCFAHQGAVL